MKKNEGYSIGDEVEVLDEAFVGIVTKITTTEVIISTPDGFELSYYPHELIRVGEKSAINQASKYADIEEAKTEKIVKNHHRVNTEKKSKKEEYAIEIDLHIEKLVKDWKKMTKFDMLNVQIDTARYQLEFAIKNRIPRVIFIHGVGDGVLKTELEYLFGRYPEITFADANYRKYGIGATEVYVKQNF